MSELLLQQQLQELTRRVEKLEQKAPVIPFKFNGNVSLCGLSPQAASAFWVAYTQYCLLGANSFVVTSCNDGKHSRKSKHYRGDAFDIRIWTLPEDARIIAAERIADALGRDFDVVFENDHIHVEYDPEYRES